MCNEEPASEYCTDCGMHLCGSEGADCGRELHSARHMRKHKRNPYKQVANANITPVVKATSTRSIVCEEWKAVERPKGKKMAACGPDFPVIKKKSARMSSKQRRDKERQEKRRARERERALTRQRRQEAAALRWQACQDQLSLVKSAAAVPAVQPLSRRVSDSDSEKSPPTKKRSKRARPQQTKKVKADQEEVKSSSLFSL